VIPIDVLPDDVLLDIFDFYVKEDLPYFMKTTIESWQKLVHVCRRWRSVIFGSPHRLNLQLFCTSGTPARDTLDVWPALPLNIYGILPYSNVDNIIVGLGHSNRVCEVHLSGILRRQLEEVLALMQVPFPELTKLWLSNGDTLPVIPDSFLGGSAPRLRALEFWGIPFPGLPKLLLSATYLVQLELYSIPHSGYISPEAMVALLSVLSSLERLSLRFRSPQSRPDSESRRPPPSRLFVIPSLTRFDFEGVSEYLEDLVTCIDAPQLDYLQIKSFNQIDFDTPRLAQFINRTPTFRARYEARVEFDDKAVYVKLMYWIRNTGHVVSEIGISCREPDWQLSAIAQVCNSSLPPLSTVEDLHIELGRFLYGVWKDDAIENALWLELLLPFLAVKDLYLAKELAPGIAAALQQLVGGRITEVLPSLRNIFVKGIEPQEPFREHIGEFVAARQLSGHPVAISVWRNEFEWEFVPLAAETVED
jgi:hypothetical protein